MKTRIIQPTEQKPEQPIKYPCLMGRDDGTAVYATGKTSGVVLTRPDGSCGETYYDNETVWNWENAGYTPMRGKVVIEFDMEDNQ